MLPSTDTTYLAERGVNHSVSTDANMTCILIRDFALPAGYKRPKSDLLLRFNAGYPDVPPDMWWFDPPVRRADGQAIPATEVVERYFDRSWQRWSRHLPQGLWNSGIDGLESFLALGDLRGFPRKEGKREIDMRSTVFAGVIGALSAIVATILVVAVVSAVGGVPVMFDPDRKVAGWEGAQSGMMLLVLLGVGKGWPFPAIALMGAAIGVVVGVAFRRRTGIT